MKNSVGLYFLLFACGSHPTSTESHVMASSTQGLDSEVVASFPNDVRCFDTHCSWVETFNKGAAFAINVANPNQRISVPLRTRSLAQVDQSTAWIVGTLAASLIDLATGEPRADEVVFEQNLLKAAKSDTRMAWLLQTSDGVRIEMRNLKDGELLWSDELTSGLSISLQPQADLGFTADGGTLLYIHPMWSIYAYDAATGLRASPVATPKMSHVKAAFWNGRVHALLSEQLNTCAFESAVALPSPNHVACVDVSSPNAVVLVDLSTGVVFARKEFSGYIESLTLLDAQTLRVAASVDLNIQIFDLAIDR